MLQIALEDLVVAVTGLALLFYLGSGLAMWLPTSLVPYRWAIAPWAGFSLLAITTQFLSNAPCSLTGLQSAYVAIALATIVNAASVRRGLRLRRAAASRQGDVPYRWLTLMSLGVFVLCVLPTWNYGFSNVIGENWDMEMYLALGEYLKSYSQSGLGTAPPNPILFKLLEPPVSERTQAFAYFQAALGILPLDSLRTFVPGLALIRALSIPAVYIFFTTWFRLSVRAALLATAAISINAFLLWITYNSFAMQVPSFGLLALALSMTLIAINAGREDQPLGHAIWPSSLWIGFFVGALAVAYNPALTAYIAMAGLPILVTVWVCIKNRSFGAAWRVVRSIALAAAVGLALSLVSQLMSFGGFLLQYNEQSGGMGLESFTSPGDSFGFSLSFRDLLPADPGRQIMSFVSRLYTLAGWVALFVALCLIALYLYRISRGRKAGENGPWLWQVWALLASALAYSLVFLLILHYPYGWFKSLSFIAPVLVGTAVGGLDYILQWRRLRKVAALGSMVLLALMVVTTVLTTSLYWGEPIRFNREMVEAGNMRPLVSESDPGARSVYIAGSPGMQNLGRLFNGLLSYFLRDTDLYGHYSTAYGELNKERPNGVYDYTVLRAGDNPSEYGVGGGTLVWHNLLLSLYALPVTGRRDLYHKNYRDDGNYPQISVGQPLTFTVEPETLMIPGETGGTASSMSNSQLAPRQFTLGLAAPTTSTLRLQFPGASAAEQVVTITVPPGYTAYRSGMVMAPSQIDAAVAPSGEAQGSIYVRWAHLDSYEGASNPPPGLFGDGNGLLLWLSSREGSDSQPLRGSAKIDFDYLNSQPNVVSQTLSLDIYGRGGNSLHYGYWNFDVPDNRSLSGTLELDLHNKSLVVESGPAQVTDMFKGETGDGAYVASLLVYVNGRVYETFNDIFTFTIKDGAVSSFESRKLPPLFR